MMTLSPNGVNAAPDTAVISSSPTASFIRAAAGACRARMPATAAGTSRGMSPLAHRRTYALRATGPPLAGIGTPHTVVTSQFTSRIAA